MALVLISLLGTHFVRGHDAAGNHVLLVPTTSSAPAIGPAAAAVAEADDAAGSAPTLTPALAAHASTAGSIGGSATEVGCALLLLVGLGIALSWWLRRRSVGDRRPATWSALQRTLRGPPKPVARLVLCVERT